jgi:hypothetical protein
MGTGGGRPLLVTRWCWRSTAASGNSLALYSTSRSVRGEGAGKVPDGNSPMPYSTARTVLRGGDRSNPISLTRHIAMRLTGLAQYAKGLAYHNAVERLAL